MRRFKRDKTFATGALADRKAIYLTGSHIWNNFQDGGDEIFVGGGHPMAPGSPLSRWFDNPPASEGRKVIITDTDHYAPGQGDTLWAWKAFLRGQHPILMDFGLINGVKSAEPSAGDPAYASFEPARYAMGDTLRCAERVDLIVMTPRSDLTSTGYALANPGQEYLVLQPDEPPKPFTVMLAAGSYRVEWYSINSRRPAEAGQVAIARGGSRDFTPPFAEGGPVVLYLKQVSH